ncbi:MAG: DNA polymerase IV [Candidatus Lokiarchaeota archaeon]|nr:DNA polymerase IV [Candidatus Lokiarchaeota archaeon]
MKRFILHCDLDAFFASVEVRDNPDYQDKPVIIGADPKDGKGRGVISTCNYEARKFGLHSAMPISQAFKRCPQGIYLRPNFKKYHEASHEVMEIINSYSQKFQQVSIDEAYIDISEICVNFDDVQELTLNLQQKVYESVGITVSIGCASSKSIAKIASDFKKPNGITIVKPEEFKEFLSPMDITRIPGIGKKSKEYYNKQGIRVIGDIIKIPLHRMIEKFGKNGKWAWEIANGLDKREVKNSMRDRKSISKERTFFKDTNDFQEILTKLDEINEKLHEKVQKDKISYKTITLKIRLEGFLTYTRSKTLPYHTQNKEKTIDIILELFKEFSKDNRKIRLIGIKLSNLTSRSKIIQKDLLSFVNE